MEGRHETRPPALPLDPHDPRFADGGGNGRGPARPRRLVRSEGPGSSPFDERVRILRVAVPVLFALGVAATAAMFVAGLDPSPTQDELLGPEADVRAAVADGPVRVCLDGEQPCAWVDDVGGELVALSAAGPVRDELGRAGVGWCASAGYYGSNNTGARYDRMGRLVRGPARRGLDRYRIAVRDGLVRVDFADLRAGPQAHQTTETIPAEGPDCEDIPFEAAETAPLTAAEPAPLTSPTPFDR